MESEDSSSLLHPIMSQLNPVHLLTNISLRFMSILTRFPNLRLGLKNSLSFQVSKLRIISAIYFAIIVVQSAGKKKTAMQGLMYGMPLYFYLWANRNEYVRGTQNTYETTDTLKRNSWGCVASQHIATHSHAYIGMQQFITTHTTTLTAILNWVLHFPHPLWEAGQQHVRKSKHKRKEKKKKTKCRHSKGVSQ